MTQKELAKKLEEADIPLSDWYEHCATINELISSTEPCIYFQWIEEDVMVDYYSDKLHKAIILSYEANENFDSYDDMATTILGYLKEAKDLEAKISLV